MDTTAKVDIRKLQLLNDRIAQTIDALNQVRLSVHGLGLSHTGASIPGVGIPSPFQGTPFPGAYGASMYGSWPAAAQGLSHTGAYAQSPYAQYAQASGYAQPHVGAIYGQQAMNPLLSQLLWQQGIGGLSHTSDVFGASGYPSVGYAGVGYPQAGYQGYPSAGSVDPITASRIMQMFPFAQMPVSPVV